ncbi:RND family transporter [Mycobacteroides abscessus]|uniref:MMPL/RND family transporter n=1 Tax=Mycobacteroides abscessus TaxID=36809 RepID=UPI001D15A504|nr:RND family transporter [Mycobacteroides abscessus]UEA49407.1 RND family transporter [Mycobacteroides abscessus subsp. abscessus]UEA54786.1 RND family transporter [Mycobacteroides abscessus]
MSGSHANGEPTFVAKWIRRLSIPIVIGWVALVVILALAAPQLEQVGQENAVSLSPSDAPSMKAMKNMGRLFQESDSNSVTMIVLEGDQPLGPGAHKFYDEMVSQLRADTKHVQHVQDFWGDPLTESGAQSTDGKATYVQVNLSGDMGETLANESIEAVRDIVKKLTTDEHGNPKAMPDGLKVYVTGAAALQADMGHAGDSSMLKITGLTFIVIIIMLLFFYRSIFTVLMVLLMVGIQLGAARGMISVLGDNHIIGLSTFAVNLLVVLVIAAGTDYAIFLIGRYQEARVNGLDREAAYYEMFHGTAHVILGTGSTIAGAMYCLSFTRMPYFQTLGVPCAVAVLTAVAVALTVGPSLITIGSKLGLFEPKRAMRIRTWRRIGAAITRWPGPILAASMAIAIIGLAALPGYKTSYDDKKYIPKDIPANQGFQAADRHFDPARMNPEMLILESDHDMRNSADFLVIDKLAKAVYRVPGIARVQAITRPQGTPIEHSSIPFLISAQGVGQVQNLKLMKDRMADMKVQADQMGVMVTTMKKMLANMTELTGVMHQMIVDMHTLQGTIHDMRDSLENFDDWFRPIKNYFYWEKHCFDIPVCQAFRSIFEVLDKIDELTENMDGMIVSMEQMDVIMPKMVEDMRDMIPLMESMQNMMLTMHSTMAGMYDLQDETSKDSTAMGRAFDKAKNDDSFYLPPEIFDNPDFKRGLKMFLSPDGKTLRMIISHRGDPTSPEGLSHIEPIKLAAIEAVKGTPLEDAKIELGGTAATFHDMADGARYDLMIAGISALCLIFLIMLLITRSFVASLVIVGTVLLSLGASFGLSVIIWQYILGKELHWMVMQMAIIVLLAVGSDYNLLLVSRLKEELPGGLKTGMIRAMGGTGSVVTSAGLVFAFTMMAMAISDLTIIGQVGTTIGLGLLFDTLVVRSFMTPAIATILGRWFWWPLNVRTRPLPPPRTPQPDTTPPPPAPAPVGAGPDPATTEFPRPSY